MFVNIQQLMSKKEVKKQAYDFISVTKKITNDNVGQVDKTQFSEQEMAALRKHPAVEDLAPLESNQFHVVMGGGSLIPFKTDIFLESLKEDFIDSVPPGFTWTPGTMEVPIIVATVFYEGYNVVAPTLDLPQFSQETITGVPLTLKCEGNGKENIFRARIVGFSDRVNSILVPKPFLDWANREFGSGETKPPGKIYVKTADANHPDFVALIDENGYVVNREALKMGRAKKTLQGIFSGLAVFGVMVVMMALMLFSFYLQLVIARSRDNLQLLLTLGYSPRWLSSHVSRQFIPVYILVVLAALVATQGIQFAFHRGFMFGREEIATPVHWSVVLVALLLVALSVLANFRTVRRLVYKLY